MPVEGGGDWSLWAPLVCLRPGGDALHTTRGPHRGFCVFAQFVKKNALCFHACGNKQNRGELNVSEMTSKEWRSFY